MLGLFSIASGGYLLNGVMMPFHFYDILYGDHLQVPPYGVRRETKLATSGIYGYIRHPLQSGALSLIIFGNGVYTTERLIFVGLNVVMVVIGVLM
jgi:protein-S-isoprenylcysteine O-methyltransferase Ste14